MKIKIISLSILLAAAALLVPASASAQQATTFFDAFLADNGGQPAQNFNLFFQWIVTDGSVDLVGGTVPGAVDQANGRFVELGGSTNDAGLFQTKTSFPFVPGVTYNLSFDYKSSDGTQNTARVSVAGQNFEVSSNLTCLQTFTRDFTVAAPIATTVAFQNLDDDNNGIGIDNVILLTQTAPTAANVSAGGRTMTSGGRAISGAVVTMADASGKVRKTKSSPFGYYRFADVPTGETYVFTAAAKKYVFAQPAQVFNINEEISSINFVAGSRSETKRRIPAR